MFTGKCKPMWERVADGLPEGCVFHSVRYNMGPCRDEVIFYFLEPGHEYITGDEKFAREKRVLYESRELS
jgi:hypothetical protein